ncbi:hypothetical protein AKL17_0925 [Frigidibacter mobilis]|uniref:DUF2125 domain-containing protein n=1 Tax=Frigidibacter mobilis TaxID=1335048 RepID=A0A159Z2A0_9RHOB|nr:DUF2125 domain-containing protein [Frigidibacter mobilis]AMY68184.1 hypothetical protein AKL17_0925 [Frigidibacter mobilis]
MRALLWITTAAAVLYGGYWVAGSTAMRRGAEAALADLQAQGIAGPAGITLRGFPSRFDLTVEPVQLRSGAVEWSAPFVQLFMLAYRPTHLIAVWPHEQALTLAGLRLAITSTDIRASAVVGANADLPLDRTVFVAKGLAINAGSTDRGATLAEARLATRATDPGRLVHDLGAELLGLTLSPALRAAADPADILPGTLDSLHLNAALTLDRPLDRHAASAPPRPVALTLRDLSLRWGDLTLTASGQLDRGRMAAYRAGSTSTQSIGARSWRWPSPPASCAPRSRRPMPPRWSDWQSCRATIPNGCRCRWCCRAAGSRLARCLSASRPGSDG